MHTARDSIARRVFGHRVRANRLGNARHIAVADGGAFASGVTSRIESPVPPQVSTTWAWRSSAASTIVEPISSTSSRTTTCEATVQS